MRFRFNIFYRMSVNENGFRSFSRPMDEKWIYQLESYFIFQCYIIFDISWITNVLYPNKTDQIFFSLSRHRLCHIAWKSLRILLLFFTRRAEPKFFDLEDEVKSSLKFMSYKGSWTENWYKIAWNHYWMSHPGCGILFSIF